MTLDWWKRRDAWELRLQRVAFAVLVYLAFHAQPRYSGQPFPVGIAGWIDFSFLGHRAVEPWVEIALLTALACYVAGRAMPIAVAVMTVLYTGAGALAYSQGMLEHHTQLLALVLLAQFVAYVQASLNRRSAAQRHQLATLYSLEVVAAGYVMAGLMKVLLSHGKWVMQVPMIVTDIAKAHGQEFCTTGEAALIPRADYVAGLILTYPNVARAMMAPALLFELGAGISVFDRSLAFVVGLGLFIMHRGIDSVMAIRFPENEALVLIYLVNVPYLLVLLSRRARRIVSQPGRTKARPYKNIV